MCFSNIFRGHIPSKVGHPGSRYELEPAFPIYLMDTGSAGAWFNDGTELQKRDPYVHLKGPWAILILKVAHMYEL